MELKELFTWLPILIVCMYRHTPRLLCKAMFCIHVFRMFDVCVCACWWSVDSPHTQRCLLAFYTFYSFYTF